ncbi:hypothetical protein F4778DRAFT_775556 [Xylariomycetidae sp. FL2044]|nr:hypothetical protein F4778DRAFT_775556 [Xylariomycetidae sp. FL2044]
MPSFVTGIGAPQLIAQDGASGMIFHSLCNSKDTPVFPNNSSAALPIDHSQLPKNGTGLSGIGYVQDGYNVAAINWLTNDDQIIHGLFNCNMTTGLYDAIGAWVISGSARPVHPDSGLSSVILGDDAGIRVYYQTEDNSTSTLKYTPAGGWLPNGYVSQDPVGAFAISSAFNDALKISVATPKDESNIEVSTLQSNGSWTISTLPTPLQNVARNQSGNSSPELPPTNDTNPEDITLNTTTTSDWLLEGWDGKPSNIGLTVDSHGSRDIFYIGNDSYLHQITEVGENIWEMAETQGDKIWPRADTPNAPFASTYDFNLNQLWIYCGGMMTQVSYQSDYGWLEASTLLKRNETDSMVSQPGSGLSTGVKAGIGIGVGVVGLGLIALGIRLVLLRKRIVKKKGEAESEAAARPNSYPSLAPTCSSGGFEGQWIHGQWIPTTVYEKVEGKVWGQYSYSANSVAAPQPVYEMPNQEYSHEIAGDDNCQELPAPHIASRRH